MLERPLRPGDLIRGDHRVVVVHRGQHGRVAICRQTLPGGDRVYKAVKTLRLGSDHVSKQLFDRELAYWVRLPPHPNIVQARDVDTIEKQIVLEFVRGPSLRDVAKRSPIEPRHLLHWGREIAAGLRFLHLDNNFLHRDLRPANVLIDTTAGLRAKISDLGIGKPFDPSRSTHTVIGTFTYMAPEVHEGRTDFRSDIFSFGATMYYLATGRYAVSRTTKNMVSVVPPEEFVPGLPEAASALICKCVERDPAARYQSMDEVVAALALLHEWPAAWPYAYCREHAYSYYAANEGARCPFCRFDQEFSKQEAALDELLRAGG